MLMTTSSWVTMLTKEHIVSRSFVFSLLSNSNIPSKSLCLEAIMKTSMSTGIQALERSAHKDLARILMTPIVLLQRSMKPLSKCLWQLLSLISSKEFSAVMEVLDLLSKILKLSIRSRDQLRSSQEQIPQRIIRKSLIFSGVIHMKAKMRMASSKTL